MKESIAGMKEKKYVIISPVRNEAKFIGNTLESVVAQTMKPVEWVIVNDGSTDRTEEIVQQYCKIHKWIKLVTLKDRGYYLPGPGVIEAFYKGLQACSRKDWDFIVKLDCDLSFEQDYFEKILQEFEVNPKLGMASGATFILNKRGLRPEKTQADHPVGPSKIYRAACYYDIGGIRLIPGWDLADVIDSQMKGWQTKCFARYRLIHLRKTGVKRKGFTKGRFLLGRFQYRFGYTFFYTFLKGLYWLPEKPYLLGGVGIISGYIFARIRGEKRIFSEDMVYHLRKKQKERLISILRKVVFS